MLRGGGWSDRPGGLRSAPRDRSVPAYQSYDVGFRVVVVAAR